MIQDPETRNLVQRVVIGVIAVIVLGVGMSAWVNIPQGTVGVVFDKFRGGVLPQTLGQGWRFRLPIIQWIQEYPVSLRTYHALGIGEGTEPKSNSVDLPTLEGQHIQMDVSVVYNVIPSSASRVFDMFKGAAIEDIEISFIRRTVISVANIVAGKYSIMDIYGPKKGVVQQEILEKVRAELAPWGFEVDRVNLGAARFPQAIEASLQQKIQAQQQAESARFSLLQAEIDAKARIAKAEGEARANTLVQASLTPKLVNLRAIEKWDGRLPTYMLGGNTIPFLNVKPE